MPKNSLCSGRAGMGRRGNPACLKVSDLPMARELCIRSPLFYDSSKALRLPLVISLEGSEESLSS